MNKDSYSGIDVFLYLAVEKDIEIKNRGKGTNAIRLESEIWKAFKDSKKELLS